MARSFVFWGSVLLLVMACREDGPCAIRGAVRDDTGLCGCVDGERVVLEDDGDSVCVSEAGEPGKLLPGDAGQQGTTDGSVKSPQGQTRDAATGTTVDASNPLVGVGVVPPDTMAASVSDAGPVMPTAPACVPAAEVCDQKDNDCDGATDEDNVCAPPAVKGTVEEIAAGDLHTCARFSTGAVSCWGSNSKGQLGNGNRVDQKKPVAVVGLTDAVQLALGSQRSCARRASGAVMCWGVRADNTAFVTAPTAVPDLNDAALLAAGSFHTCALRDSGAVVCWGYGGTLGDSGLAGSDSPKQVGTNDPSIRVLSVAANDSSVCAATDIFGVSCWGAGALTPRPPYSVSSVAGGASSHMCGLTSSSTGSVDIYCWGSNEVGQLGVDAATASGESAVSVPGLDAVKVSSVAVGGSTSCARTSLGIVYCWGNNSQGQLGDGSLQSRSAPAPVPALTSASQVAVGGLHACALSANLVTCWGANSQGQLGDGTTTAHSTPVAVAFP